MDSSVNVPSSVKAATHPSRSLFSRPAGNGPSDRGFQPYGVAAAGAVLPAPGRPGAGAADRRAAGLRPAGVDDPAAADGPVRRAAVTADPRQRNWHYHSVLGTWATPA